MAEIGDIISATGNVASGAGGQRADFGGALILTESTLLDAVGTDKVRAFSDQTAVEQFFGASADVTDMANVWFGREDGYPLGQLNIGRWVANDINSQLLGTAPGTVAAIVAATPLALVISAIPDGTTTAATATLSVITTSLTTYADIAAAIQVQVRASTPAVFDNVTVTYNSAENRFEFTMPISDGDFNVALNGANAATIGMDDATVLSSVAAESVTEALTEIEMHAGAYIYLGAEEGIASVEADALAIQTYAANNRKMAMLGFTGDDPLVTNENTSIVAAFAASDQQSRYGFGVWNHEHDYPELSLGSAFAAVDWDGTRTLRDAKFVRPYRIDTANGLTTAQRTELTRKRCNYATPFGGVSIFAEGQTWAPGYWLDTQLWLMWFLDRIQVDTFNAFVDSGRTPMTEEGRTIIEDTVAAVCEQGIENGGIGPGRSVRPVTQQQIRSVTGNRRFNGDLPSGYLIWVPPLENITVTQRETRTYPQTRIWITGSGAIHFASFDIVLED